VLKKLCKYFSGAPEEEIAISLHASHAGRGKERRPNSFVKHGLTDEPITPEQSGPEGPVIAY